MSDCIGTAFPRDLLPAQAAVPAAAPEPQWEHSALDTVEAHQFYNAVGRTGIKYGPHFRMVQRTNISADTEALLRCALVHFHAHYVLQQSHNRWFIPVVTE